MLFSFSFLNFNLFHTVIALRVCIDRSGGCVDLDRTFSMAVGLSGKHCTIPLDKCALLKIIFLINEGKIYRLLGALKYRLRETVLLGAQNRC